VDNSDERRDQIHALLQELGPANQEANGALLTGWVVVTSWVAPDGTAWLSRGHAAEIPWWTAQGMLYEGLNGVWERDED
jgi:hypothetical protein